MRNSPNFETSFVPLSGVHPTVHEMPPADQGGTQQHQAVPPGFHEAKVSADPTLVRGGSAAAAPATGETVTIPVPDIEAAPGDPDDSFYAPKPAHEPSPLLLEVHTIEETLGKYRKAAKEDPRAHALYERSLANGAKKFIDLLTSDELQAEPVILTEDGIALIAHGLDFEADIPPSAKTLSRLKAVVDAQGIGEPVTPYRLDADGNKVEDLVAKTQHPRYESRLKRRFGVYESPVQDKVAEVREKLDPASWLLNPDTREFFQQVLALDNLTDKPPEYKERPPRFFPGRPGSFIAKPGRTAMEGILKARHDRKQPEVSADDVEMTHQVVAWFQGKDINEVRALPQILGKNTILPAAQKRMLPLLKRDNELRFLKLEQDIGDNQTEGNIASFLTMHEDDRSTIGDASTRYTAEVTRRFVANEGFRRIAHLRQATEQSVINGRMHEDDVTLMMEDYIRQIYDEARDSTDVS